MEKLYTIIKSSVFKVVAVAGLLCILPAAMTSAATFVIQVSSNSFSPSSVNAAVGDTIKWMWVNGTHTTTSVSVPSGASTWDSPITSTSTSYVYKITAPGTYTYKCTPHASMGMTGTINVSGTATSIPSFAKSNIVTLFPNPFNKTLSIDFRNYDYSISKPIVEIYDIVGKQYLHTKFYDPERNGKMYIDVEFLNPGVYFIYIINNGKKDIYKIIKSNDMSSGNSSSFVPSERVCCTG